MAITRPVTKTLISTTAWGIPVTDQVNANTTALAALQPTAWTLLPVVNGWLYEGGGVHAGSYRKVGDMVQIRGGLTRTGLLQNAAVFQLPVGFRPTALLRIGVFAMQAASGGIWIMRADMASDGNFSVTDYSPSSGLTNPTLFLNGISFSTSG